MPFAIRGGIIRLNDTGVRKYESPGRQLLVGASDLC